MNKLKARIIANLFTKLGDCGEITAGYASNGQFRIPCESKEEQKEFMAEIIALDLELEKPGYFYNEAGHGPDWCACTNYNISIPVVWIKYLIK